MSSYEDFVISMEPASLAVLATIIRSATDETPKSDDTVKAELQNLACEIEARLQKHRRIVSEPSVEDWLA